MLIKWLTRREHARYELEQKLLSLATEPSLIQSLLDELQQQGWQSDQRYAEMFVNTRLQQGYGPLRIQQECTNKRVADEFVRAALLEKNAFDESWIARCWHKRFGDEAPITAKLYQKQLRFLLYRGYSSEAAQRWLRQMQAEGK